MENKTFDKAALMMNEPEKIPATELHIIVMQGRKELRRTWRMTILNWLTPLASAVKI